ncbi:MAG: DUF3566 domain-containing protein [Acidobacteria bacterium]|nr:DUF3566 domain-containing protein [Acidobacteriota bacterium]
MPVRRVRRVVRKIDPWTVFKVTLIFNAIAALIFGMGVWVMWEILDQRGIPQSISEVFSAVDLVYTPDGDLYMTIVRYLAIMWTVLATASMTLGAIVYNLISDIVGGIELTVLEETYDPNPRSSQVSRIRDAMFKPQAKQA